MTFKKGSILQDLVTETELKGMNLHCKCYVNGSPNVKLIVDVAT